MATRETAKQTVEMSATPSLRPVSSEVRLTWAEATEEFLADRKLLNYSPSSLVWYTSVFGAFGRFRQESGAPDDLAKVTEPDVRAFLARVQSEGAKGRGPTGPKWVNNVRQALKSIFAWAVEEGYVTENPVAGIAKLKEPRRIIQTLSADQVRALVEQPDLRSPVGHRNRCFLLILLDTGLRLSEALGLRVGEVDLEGGVAKVLGKGSKERLVGLSPGLVSELRPYLRRRQQALEEIGRPEAPWLSPNNVGGRLCSKTMEQAVWRYGIAAGIDPNRVRLSPHTLRHTYAVTFVRNGGDPFTLQKVLGHSSLDTSRRYCELANEDVQRRMRDLSPVAALGLASTGGRRVRRSVRNGRPATGGEGGKPGSVPS